MRSQLPDGTGLRQRTVFVTDESDLEKEIAQASGSLRDFSPNSSMRADVCNLLYANGPMNDRGNSHRWLGKKPQKKCKGS